MRNSCSSTSSVRLCSMHSAWMKASLMASIRAGCSLASKMVSQKSEKDTMALGLGVFTAAGLLLPPTPRLDFLPRELDAWESACCCCCCWWRR